MDSDPEFEVVPGSTHTVGGGAYGLVDRMTVKYKSDQQERQVSRH